MVTGKMLDKLRRLFYKHWSGLKVLKANNWSLQPRPTGEKDRIRKRKADCTCAVEPRTQRNSIEEISTYFGFASGVPT